MPVVRQRIEAVLAAYGSGQQNLRRSWKRGAPKSTPASRSSSWSASRRVCGRGCATPTSKAKERSHEPHCRWRRSCRCDCRRALVYAAYHFGMNRGHVDGNACSFQRLRPAHCRARTASARCSTGTTRWCPGIASTSRASRRSWTCSSCPSTPTRRKVPAWRSVRRWHRTSAFAPRSCARHRSRRRVEAVRHRCAERALDGRRAVARDRLRREAVRSRDAGSGRQGPAAGDDLSRPSGRALLSEYLGAAQGEHRSRRSSRPRASGCACCRFRTTSLRARSARASRNPGSRSTSPISGVVAELGAREGVMVQPGMALFRIVDLSSVWVEASVPEAQAAQTCEIGAIGAREGPMPIRGARFPERCRAILPQVDPATRTLRARLDSPIRARC